MAGKPGRCIPRLPLARRCCLWRPIRQIHLLSMRSIGDLVLRVWGMLKSVDSGENWTELNTGLSPDGGFPDVVFIPLVAVSPTAPATVYTGYSPRLSCHACVRTSDEKHRWRGYLECSLWRPKLCGCARGGHRSRDPIQDLRRNGRRDFQHPRFHERQRRSQLDRLRSIRSQRSRGVVRLGLDQLPSGRICKSQLDLCRGDNEQRLLCPVQD